MHRSILAAVGALALASAGTQAAAAPLTPNAGTLTASGTLSGNATGTFTVQAVLKDGNFSGTATLVVNGSTLSGTLLDKRSYLENGHCVFRVENGRAHADIRGTCDSATFDGTVDAFIPGTGGAVGKASGNIVLAGGAPAPQQGGTVPSGKLVCAYMEPKISFKWGEAAQYSLHYSNLVSLTLFPNGTYAAGKSGRGNYTIQNGKVKLASGPWVGAIGSLENDRSGKPAVVFHIEENKRPDGVHIVDPYTTRCTSGR